MVRETLTFGGTHSHDSQILGLSIGFQIKFSPKQFLEDGPSTKIRNIHKFQTVRFEFKLSISKSRTRVKNFNKKIKNVKNEGLPKRGPRQPVERDHDAGVAVLPHRAAHLPRRSLS